MTTFFKQIQTVVALITVFFFIPFLRAQPGDTSLLGDIEEPARKVQNSFKTTRVVNLQSMEVTDAGVFDLKINHRFGAINEGAYHGFGLDNAITRVGGEYGVIPNLMVGFGRSSYAKTIDGYFKYRLMHQTTDNKKPFSLLFAGSMAYRGERLSFPVTGIQRLSYVSQLILGRKFSESFSMQLVPTVVHHNLSPFNTPNRQYALGIGIRQKLTSRTTLNLEYIPVFSELGEGVYNSLSVGFDIETGGHVFQLHFTNSQANNEANFISRTTGDWSAGAIRFGFNISRVFTIVDPSRFPNNSY